jgi:Asp-tRNA(Asn)/Glu-tRNA(Gln) amidotransferase A subunit family amidase
MYGIKPILLSFPLTTVANGTLFKVTGDLQNRYEGFPMAIQLVGQYQQEPKLMQLALMVDELMAAYR